MAIVKTIGQTTLPPGPGSTQTNANVADDATVMRATINKVGWPGTGEEAGSFVLSYTKDNGQTWVPTISSPFVDDPADGDALVFVGQIRDVNIGRKIRLEWSLNKTLTFSGKLEAF